MQPAGRERCSAEAVLRFFSCRSLWQRVTLTARERAKLGSRVSETLGSREGTGVPFVSTVDVESFSLLNSVFHACLVIRVHRCWGPKPGRLSVFARRANPDAGGSGARACEISGKTTTSTCTLREPSKVSISRTALMSQALSIRAPNAALVIHYNGIRPTRLVR